MACYLWKTLIELGIWGHLNEQLLVCFFFLIEGTNVNIRGNDIWVLMTDYSKSSNIYTGIFQVTNTSWLHFVKSIGINRMDMITVFKCDALRLDDRIALKSPND